MTDSTLSFEEVEALFQTLGIKAFAAALPEGKIHWMNAAGEVVAHGSCFAVLSYAPGNSSMMWAEEIAQFKQTGVPCAPRPDGLPGYQEAVMAGVAEALATRVARGAGARFLYRAPTGGGGTLFLGVTEFFPGGLDANPDDARRRVAAARAWAHGTLSALAEQLDHGQDPAESALLIARLRDQARQQAEFVLKGLDAAAAIAELGEQADRWARSVGDQAERVAYEMGVAARAWGDATPSA